MSQVSPISQVAKEEVIRYYIESELGNIVSGDNWQPSTALEGKDLERLLEALSFTFRANGIFDVIQSGQYIWQKRQVKLDEILLTGMGEFIDRHG